MQKLKDWCINTFNSSPVAFVSGLVVVTVTITIIVGKKFGSKIIRKMGGRY